MSDVIKAGTLRIWHIPQVPGKPFQVIVRNVEEAKLLLRALTGYDIFQYENHIRPDFASAQGLEVFEDGEWVEWHDDDDRDIAELMRNE